LNTVTWWDVDDAVQRSTTTDEILQKIRDSRPGNVQFWFGPPGEDLFIEWQQTEMTIYFDGTELQKKRTVLHAIFDNFISIRKGPIHGWKIVVGTEDVVDGGKRESHD
jgi:hypothetical protein